MAAKKDNVRVKAEEYYVEHINATFVEIAEIYPVSTKTLSGWATRYKWDDRRRDYHSSPVKIKQLIQDELLSVAQGKDPKLPADSISKLMAALDKLEKKLDPIVVSKVLKELDVFISKINPQFAIEATQYHKQFLQHRIALEG